MFTDTHCHLFKDNYANLDKIISELNTNNLKRVIINGYNYKTNLEVLKLINQYDNVYGALGIHPSYLDEGFDESIRLIEENIDNKKIVAIGEIGLDYYHNQNKEAQLEKFHIMLKLAEEYHKPVIIHSRDSTQDMINTLKQYKVKGVMHCFSGSYESANEYTKMGFKLGINGIITFKNSKLKEVLEKIELKNILLETDSPYITPEPFRKYQNEPKYINEVAKTTANCYKTSESELAKELEKNLFEIFDF